MENEGEWQRAGTSNSYVRPAQRSFDVCRKILHIFNIYSNDNPIKLLAHPIFTGTCRAAPVLSRVYRN